MLSQQSVPFFPPGVLSLTAGQAASLPGCLPHRLLSLRVKAASKQALESLWRDCPPPAANSAVSLWTLCLGREWKGVNSPSQLATSFPQGEQGDTYSASHHHPHPAAGRKDHVPPPLSGPPVSPGWRDYWA